MKKKIMIATFFAAIMLLMPATSAVMTNENKSYNEEFEIPLSDEDEKEIRFLISDEKEDIEYELKNILTDEGSLKIEELEDIYEEYVETNDSSVIDSDSWSWILKRLGWIYFTMEHVITIYNDAITLYYEITQGGRGFSGLV